MFRVSLFAYCVLVLSIPLLLVFPCLGFVIDLLALKTHCTLYIVLPHCPFLCISLLVDR